MVIDWQYCFLHRGYFYCLEVYVMTQTVDLKTRNEYLEARNDLLQKQHIKNLKMIKIQNAAIKKLDVLHSRSIRGFLILTAVQAACYLIVLLNFRG